MKEDLRVIKTKKAIEDAFISLVEEKGFENVKIIDIAKRANVNRNTIYLHYSSKDMIIEDLVDKVFTSGIVTLEPNAYLKGKYSKRNLYELFLKMFTLIYEQIELYRIVLTDQNLSGYLTLRLKKVKSFVLSSLKPTFKNEIIVEYVVSGVFGIIRNWIIYDKGSIKENVELCCDLVYMNMRHAQY